MSQRAFVTGANGFIGKHLVKRLVEDGWYVTAYDRKPRPSPKGHEHRYIQGDIFDRLELQNAMTASMPAVVFHLAALADVRNALKQPLDQLEMNFVATASVLEAMRACNVKRIAFTSSAVVYGDTLASTPIMERGFTFPQQTSIYGAMKLASESLIAAYCHGYGMTADIYRLVSLVGEGYRHGNLMDFYRKVQADPTKLAILGTGKQEKYYIAVSDVIDAIMLTLHREHVGAELWNVSHDQPNTINDSVQAVCDALDLHPQILHEGDPWAGDLPQLVLDCSKLRALGWEPKVAIKDGMRRTVLDFIERAL